MQDVEDQTNAVNRVLEQVVSLHRNLREWAMNKEIFGDVRIP